MCTEVHFTAQSSYFFETLLSLVPAEKRGTDRQQQLGSNYRNAGIGGKQLSYLSETGGHCREQEYYRRQKDSPAGRSRSGQMPRAPPPGPTAAAIKDVAMAILQKCPDAVPCCNLGLTATEFQVWLPHLPDDKVWRCLVHLKYWTLNLMVYPKVLFRLNFIIKVRAASQTAGSACPIYMTRSFHLLLAAACLRTCSKSLLTYLLIALNSRFRTRRVSPGKPISSL